jgi:type I restriction enzyme, S subunit
MNDWKKVLLGEISEIQGGLQVTSRRNSLSVEAPYLRVANVYRNYLDLDEIKKIRLTERELERTSLESGDLLVVEGHGNPNEVGRVAMWDGSISPCVHQNHLIRVRLDSRAVPAFIVTLLNSPEGRLHLLRSANTTSGLNTISTSDVRTTPVILPPLEEQRRIAEVLGKSDGLRAKRRRAIALLDDLVRSIFLDMFGDPSTNPKNWPTGNLGEIITDGPQNGLYRPASEYGSGVPIVRIDSFRDGVIPDFSRLKRLRVPGNEVARWALRPDDLLINRVNSLEHLGKSALVPTLAEPTVYESNMMRFAVDGNILNPQFLIQVLQSADIKRQILSRAKNAVNQSSINQRDVRALRIILPPLRLQLEFVQEIKAARHIIRVARQQLRKLDELFAALQVRAFRGEL